MGLRADTKFALFTDGDHILLKPVTNEAGPVRP